MKLIAIIDNSTSTILEALPDYQPTIIRKAARAVVRDSDGHIYLMHATTHNYYKLPGGGIDAGESIEAALRREVHEELGYDVEIGSEVGTVIECNVTDGFRQDSYAYHVTMTNGNGQPQFTETELAAGFVTQMCDDIDAAIKLLQHHSGGNQMVTRDLLILREARNG